jgi:two-component system NarL family response regulator
MGMTANADMLLMDIWFDGGLDAIKPILSSNPNIMIIIFTMNDLDEILFTAIRTGARGYLLKHVPFNGLIASIRALERGEPAVSRCMMARILEEFRQQSSPTRRIPESVDRLTWRELEILKELGTGATNREIAHRLYISENTVKIHVRNIYNKLKLRNRQEVRWFSHRMGQNIDLILQ